MKQVLGVFFLFFLQQLKAKIFLDTHNMVHIYRWLTRLHYLASHVWVVIMLFEFVAWEIWKMSIFKKVCNLFRCWHLNKYSCRTRLLHCQLPGNRYAHITEWYHAMHIPSIERQQWRQGCSTLDIVWLGMPWRFAQLKGLEICSVEETGHLLS